MDLGIVESLQTRGIDLKVVCAWMLLIFLSALISSMLAFMFPIDFHKKFGSKINCLGSGLLLGTCFFHLLPEALIHYQNAAISGQVDGEQAIKNFMLFIILGILTIILFEQTATCICSKGVFNKINNFFSLFSDKQSSKSSNKPELISLKVANTSKDNITSNSINITCNNTSPVCNLQPNECCSSSKIAPNNQKTPSYHSVNMSPRLGMQDSMVWSGASDHTVKQQERQSKIRSLILIFSLSIHSLFEGMALTFNSGSWSSAKLIGISLIPHKVAVGFTIGFQIRKTLGNYYGINLLAVWSLITPLGSILGMLISQYAVGQLFSQAINAFALGTFFYVLFFEIAPAEFNHTHDDNCSQKSPFEGLVKGLILTAGVALTFGMSQLPHSHSHGVYENDKYGDASDSVQWSNSIEQVFNENIAQYRQCMWKTISNEMSYGMSLDRQIYGSDLQYTRSTRSNHEGHDHAGHSHNYHGHKDKDQGFHGHEHDHNDHDHERVEDCYGNYLQPTCNRWHMQMCSSNDPLINLIHHYDLATAFKKLPVLTNSNIDVDSVLSGQLTEEKATQVENCSKNIYKNTSIDYLKPLADCLALTNNPDDDNAKETTGADEYLYDDDNR